MTNPTLPSETVRELLRSGAATALLPGAFPVSIKHDNRWWHQLADAPADTDFVLAPADLASRYDELLARRAASDDALHGAAGR